MQCGGNAKFVAYAKKNGLHGTEISSKYQSEAAAVYAAQLKSEATGEPYVAPPPTNRPKPKVMSGRPTGATGMGGVTTHAASLGRGMGTGGTGNMGGMRSMENTNGMGNMGGRNGSMGSRGERNGTMGSMGGRNGSMGGMGSSGYGSGGANTGGISSDMWNQTKGDGAAMQNMASASSALYQKGGGANGGRDGSGFGGFGGFGSMPTAANLNNVGQSVTRNISNIAAQVQSSEVLGQAGKAAAQAGGMLSSWFTNVSSQATKIINDDDGRDDLRRNLRQNLAPGAAGAGFKGFSSEDYMKSYGSNGNNTQPTMNGGAMNGKVMNGNMSASNMSAPVAKAPVVAPVQAKVPVPNGDAWGGFDDLPAEPKEKKDAWGAWD